MLDLVIGIVTLAAATTWLVFQWRRGGASPRDWVMPLFFIAWSVLWIFTGEFPRTFAHIDNLVEAYETGRYQVVEGVVDVRHQQPSTGHTKGDAIVVNGVEFEVNYFLATPAYRDTLAHGGVEEASTLASVT